MTISTTDLKIYQSQRNRDTADGGGAMSPNEVVDGVLNNVFDDISSEDRVGGRVSIRKIFPGVFSDNTDRFYGAGLLLIKPADDEAVDVVMTRNQAYDDERAQIVDRIQSYLNPGATQLWRLFNDHLQGTASLTVYAPSTAPSPDLGDTWFLEDPDGVQDTEGVKVQSIQSREAQTFYDTNGSAFQRDVMVIQLSRPLQADWPGSQVLPSTVGSPPTRIRSATVSDGAEYYGVKEVTADISADDLTIQVDNPFARIVPTTSAEQPVTDERASLSGVSYTQTGDADSLSVSASQSYSAGDTNSWYFGTSLLPGSVSVSGSISATDNADGTLDIAGSGYSGTIDYQTGEVAIFSDSGGTLNLSLTATPAAAVQDSTQTTQIAVTPQTRRQTYIRTVQPRPAPGTVAVDYRAQGSWYRLTDDGNGSLSGASPGQGGGTVDYATGTISATLAAQPDVGTTVIFSWGTGVRVSNESGTTAITPPQISLQITDGPIEPGSLTITYDSGGSQVTHTTDTAGYVIDAGSNNIGRYVPATGEIAFVPSASEWPDADAAINLDYERSTEQQQVFNPTPSGGSDTVTIQLGGAVETGAVEFTWNVEVEASGRTYTVEVTIVDDGNGGLVYPNGDAVSGGSVNYSTGEVTFPAAYTVTA